MSTSRYAVVRRLSRVLLLPLHGHTMANDRMRRRKAKDPNSPGDQRICTKDNCLTCCKKFTAFMFSRVGLFFVMIGYVALGGWLFQALEARNEQDMRRSMSEKLNSTLYKLWDEILRVNSYPYQDKKGNFTLYATQELEKFEATVIQQVQQGFDGRTRPDADPDWNFFGAILYAVTLVSTIGYGHITTKTVQGKVATVLYSAFGVPLMMLFVANIGSTMAKMFAFVFSRIKMICCCRWRNKAKRKSVISQQREKRTSQIADENRSIEQMPARSSLKPIKDEHEIKEKTSNDNEQELSSQTQIEKKTSLNSLTESIENPNTDTKPLPADVRLDMLTGVSTTGTLSRSLTSSTHAVEERPKDAIVRINELIRQNSVQDTKPELDDDNLENANTLLSSTYQDSKQSDTISPIQFYINETKKLTSNLENPIDDQANIKPEQTSTITTIDDNTTKPKIEIKKATKKQLKRSKSDPETKTTSDSSSVTDGNQANKTGCRRFFLRKLRKQAVVTNDKDKIDSLEEEPPETDNKPVRKFPRKSLSFNQPIRSIPPPPNYEESNTNEIAPVPNVTWKPDTEIQSIKTTFDFPLPPELEDEDEFDEDEQMSVPLLVTVFVIPLYLTLGAILFNIWEKWGFLNSFYFCFITLTTIGFGDFVPGSSLTAFAAKEKLISASLYILLGLVLIAMCFNLMKEQLSQKVKQIAGKWGILEL